MDFLLDNPEVEKHYNTILSKIKLRKNGVVSDAMKHMGLVYETNWGVSIVELRELAREYDKNHLLALKLWNKNWRESKIMATLLDEPQKVTEEQMDFWTKSFDNIELAEQAVANLWVYSPFAFVKSLEWCRGKKHVVRFTGVQLVGRLAMIDKSAIDEMFDPFFDVFNPLAKDPKLTTVLNRSLELIGRRSQYLDNLVKQFSVTLKETGIASAVKLSMLLLDDR